MSGLSRVAEWDEIASHLVRGHGADPDRLTSYVLSFAQLRWAHFDTHAALEIAGVRPPDGHTHLAGLEAALQRPVIHFTPFEPAPAASQDQDYQLDVDILGMPDPRYTGLPHTLVVPPDPGPDPAHPGDWAREAIRAYRAHWREHGEPGPAQSEAAARERIRSAADAAAVRHLTRASFPAGLAGQRVAVAAAVRRPMPQVPRRTRGR